MLAPLILHTYIRQRVYGVGAVSVFQYFHTLSNSNFHELNTAMILQWKHIYSVHDGELGKAGNAYSGS